MRSEVAPSKANVLSTHSRYRTPCVSNGQSKKNSQEDVEMYIKGIWNLKINQFCLVQSLDCFLFHELLWSSIRQVSWSWRPKGRVASEGKWSRSKSEGVFSMISFFWIHQKLNGTLPKKVTRAIKYPGLGVRSVGPVGDFLDWRLMG